MLDKLRIYPKSVRVVVIAMFLLAAIGGTWLGASALRIYRANLHELKGTLSAWKTGGKDERVLVVAPHCDDESIACSGIIHDTLARGGHVRVVVVTNGDGFYEVFRRLKRAGPRSYIRLGEKRQQETLAAMRVLGLKDEDVIFLGYPDRGTSGMWVGNWTPDKPYRSRFTKCSSSPYPNSFRKDAPYCGRALLADLESIILSFRPTSVYCPHPSDLHSDHWAVSCFVTQALYELSLTQRVRLGMYLVHRGDEGDWPIPDGLHPSRPLAPPAYLTNIGVNWHEYPLSKEDVALKLRAIRMYRSQLPFLGEFLYSFVRKNEMFGSLTMGTVLHVERPRDDYERLWEEAPSCISDPVGDSIRLNAFRSGDIRCIRCCYDDENLYVRVELVRPYSRRVDYYVAVCGLPDATASRLTVRVTGRSTTSDQADVKVGGNTVDVTIPLSQLGKWEALMVSAGSSIESRSVDHTAWRLLMREDDGAMTLPNPPPADRRGLRMPLSPARKPL